jgi:hypothetical protein
MKDSGRPVYQFCVLNDKVGWSCYLPGDPLWRFYSDVVSMDRWDIQASGETLPWIVRRP